MDIYTELTEATNLGTRTIRFHAVDMLRAQGSQLTAEHRAALVRQANALRAVLQTSELQELSVRVYDIYQPNVIIGHITCTL